MGESLGGVEGLDLVNGFSHGFIVPRNELRKPLADSPGNQIVVHEVTTLLVTEQRSVLG